MNIFLLKMELNALFLVLLLIISIKSNDFMDSFSIENFKIYLESNGLLKVIQSIKNVYGQDVAIISCEELNKNCSGNCQKLVTDYMEENHINSFDKTDLFVSENKTFQSQEPTEPPENKIKELLNIWIAIKNIIKRVENVHPNSTDNFSTFLLSSIKNNTKYLN